MNKIKVHSILVICLLLVVGGSVNAQRFASTNPAYITLVKQADSAMTKSDFATASKLYDKAFAISNKSVRTLSKAAQANAEIGKTDFAISLLNQAFQNDWKLACAYLGSHTKDFQTLKAEKRFLDLFTRCEETMTAYEKKIDQAFADSLHSLYNNDQLYRATFEPIALKHGYNSPEMANAKSLQQQLDLENQKQLKVLFAAKGFPTISKVQQAGTQTALSLLQRSDSAYISLWLPTIDSLIQVKELSAADCAYIKDFMACLQGKKQLYGTQLFRDPTDKLLKPKPYDSFAQVQKRRLNAGMPNWTDYLTQMGAEIPMPIKQKSISKKSPKGKPKK